MEIHLVERDTLYVCGYSVETTLEDNNKDLTALFDRFFSNEKEAELMALNGSKKGYYGLSWYIQNQPAQGHEHYRYLLGIKVAPENTAPDNAELRRVPKTTYAMARFTQGEDIIKAWTEFFYTEIPKAGFTVNKEHNYYFEYYPNGVHGEYELWAPVVKANI